MRALMRMRDYVAALRLNRTPDHTAIKTGPVTIGDVAAVVAVADAAAAYVEACTSDFDEMANTGMLTARVDDAFHTLRAAVAALTGDGGEVGHG